MGSAGCEVRPARADEIDALVSIDDDAGALFASTGMGGPQMQACLAEQRAALPAPEQRIAMCHARMG